MRVRGGGENCSAEAAAWEGRSVILRVGAGVAATVVTSPRCVCVYTKLAARV